MRGSTLENQALGGWQKPTNAEYAPGTDRSSSRGSLAMPHIIRRDRQINGICGLNDSIACNRSRRGG
jgi:hypothetical protein